MLEANISRKIVKFLNSLPKSMCRKRKAGPGQKGMADIAGIVQGKPVEIEVKTPGNPNPTPKQAKWLKECAEVGAITGVVMSVEDTIKILKRHNIEFKEAA